MFNLYVKIGIFYIVYVFCLLRFLPDYRTLFVIFYSDVPVFINLTDKNGIKQIF